MLVSCIALVLGARGILYWFVGRAAEASGDERFFFRTAESILQLVGLGDDESTPSRSEAFDELVGRGWFTPGMNTILAPVRLVSDSLGVARLYLALISFLLLVATTLVIRHMFGRRPAIAFLLVLGLLPYAAWFSMTLWGGSIAGTLLVLNALWTVAIATRLRQGRDVRLSEHVLLGVSIAVSILIRPTALAQLIPITGLLALAAATGGRPPDLRRTVASIGTLWLVVALMLVPWTLVIYRHFGGPFLLVTQQPSQQIARYAGEAQLDRVGHTYPNRHDYFLAVAAAEDRSFHDVATSEVALARRDIGISDELSIAPEHLRNFFAEPNRFLNRAFKDWIQSRAPGTRDGPRVVRTTVKTVNSVGWAALLATTFVVLVRYAPAWSARGYLGILLPLMTPFLLYQPLIGAPHGRHVNVFVPFYVLAIVLALTERRDESDGHREVRGVRALRRVHAGVIGAVALLTILG